MHTLINLVFQAIIVIWVHFVDFLFYQPVLIIPLLFLFNFLHFFHVTMGDDWRILSTIWLPFNHGSLPWYNFFRLFHQSLFTYFRISFYYRVHKVFNGSAIFILFVIRLLIFFNHRVFILVVVCIYLLLHFLNSFLKLFLFLVLTFSFEYGEEAALRISIFYFSLFWFIAIGFTATWIIGLDAILCVIIFFLHFFFSIFNIKF